MQGGCTYEKDAEAFQFGITEGLPQGYYWMLIGTIIFVLVGRFIFSAVCLGSGAPGGIFFPLLVLGGLAGGLLAAIGVQFMGLDLIHMNNFISYLLSLSVVTIVAYIVATLLKSKPIYESLLERLLEKQGKRCQIRKW